ncbi:MAG: hypothetical protein JW802_03360 [Campylobacterales bacterium]|nr:hypothetical protein [Campylobacterales bacterium]
MFKKILFIVLGLLVVYFIGEGIYTKVASKAKLSVLPCHKEVVVFEKIYESEPFQHALKAIQAGAFHSSISAEKATYSPSTLFTYVNLEEVKSRVNDALAVHVKEKKSGASKVDVAILLYENDMEHPGKKTKESKLYRGYLVLNVMVEEVLVYKVQIDFVDYEAKDLPQRIECAVETLMRHAKIVKGYI